MTRSHCVVVYREGFSTVQRESPVQVGGVTCPQPCRSPCGQVQPYCCVCSLCMHVQKCSPLFAAVYCLLCAACVQPVCLCAPLHADDVPLRSSAFLLSGAQYKSAVPRCRQSEVVRFIACPNQSRWPHTKPCLRFMFVFLRSRSCHCFRSVQFRPSIASSATLSMAISCPS